MLRRTLVIGPLGDFHVRPDERRPSPRPTPFDHNVSYIIKRESIKTAPEHEVFFRLQEPHHSLHHNRQYCRRAFEDCQNHDPLSTFAIQRWEHACVLIDQLWAACEKRPSYMDYYFTTSTLGVFVGEVTYINTYSPNFLGLSYLGSVNVHKDRLKSVLAFAAAAYGGLHVAAWNDYFPSEVERILWITCSLIIASSGIFFWLYFLAKQSIEKIDIIGSRLSRTKALSVVPFILVPILIGSRVYLVIEAFVSLRRVPSAVYQTPEWSQFLPHF